MKNSDFLEIYLQLQNGIISDKLVTIHSPEALITFCKADKATYWNFALVKDVLSEKEISILEQIFITEKRLPSLYFENKQSLYPLQELLEKKDYHISFQEAWMFYGQEHLFLPADYKVKSVSAQQELVLFLELFQKCYQQDDSQNSYGEIGNGYIKRLREAWEKYHVSKRVEYFLFYKDKMPVALSSLISYKNVGYISNVGSLPQMRAQGFGKLATLHCVKKSRDKKHTYQFLATEDTGFLQDFYQRIGFIKKFTSINYTKGK